ncbi:MAG: hypothetical protein ACR2G2_00995 [Pseudonocardia sp.]
MVERVSTRQGGPTASSVISVASLLARDAPWAGAPDAVAVHMPARAAGAAGAARRTGATRVTGRSKAPSTTKTPSTACGMPDGRLRRFATLAWSPKWRLATLSGAFLLAGLLTNVVLLAAGSGSGAGSAAAHSDEGGHPKEGAISEPPLALPPDAPAQPATRPGAGLPMALATLGESVPAANGSTPGTLPSALLGGRANAAARSSGSTGGTGRTPTTRTGTSSAGGADGGVVRTLGDTVGSVGNARPDPLQAPVRDLGKTQTETTSGVGKAVDDLADGLLGGEGSASKARHGDARESDNRDSDKRDSGGSRSESGGGLLLGGLPSTLGR